MSEKFNTFITELDELCKKHDVTVTSSMYDQPAVWDGYDCDDIKCILDMTREIRNYENIYSCILSGLSLRSRDVFFFIHRES